MSDVEAASPQNSRGPENPPDYVELDMSTDHDAASSFQSQYESSEGGEENVFSGPREWSEYVRKESRDLMRKCKRKARIMRILSGIFAILSAGTSIYLILVSLATAIVTALNETYETSDYVIIALSSLAVTLESAKYVFKYNKRSIYFKQTRIQYRRIYRKMAKYLYTQSTDKIAGLLSNAYSNFDQLDLDAHKANFNEFSDLAKYQTASVDQASFQTPLK
jgi:hypothetical protein